MRQASSRPLRLVLISAGLLLPVAAGLLSRGVLSPQTPSVVDVYPGGDVQAALEAVARRPGKGTVRVHAGTYRPKKRGEALVFFNARHDGIALEAVGDVVLTAENRALSEPGQPGYPAAVNHVVYFGDGITRATTFRGFKVTGANGFVSGPKDLKPVKTPQDLMRSIRYRTNIPSAIESNNNLPKTQYFYVDGGGILVHGRSYPTIEDVEVFDNYASVCGGGVSVQHPPGEVSDAVLFRSCVFRDNRAAVSGSAVDILIPGSWAIFENCLFVGNRSNDLICSEADGGHGALTVFPRCRATVTQCTFAENRNGVDDWGTGSTYRDSIFWHNDEAGGMCVKDRFEIHVGYSRQVTGCVISGAPLSAAVQVNPMENRFGYADPAFDTEYRPQNRAYNHLGCRTPSRSG